MATVDSALLRKESFGADEFKTDQKLTLPVDYKISNNKRCDVRYLSMLPIDGGSRSSPGIKAW